MTQNDGTAAEHTFGAALVALGQLLELNPRLPRIYAVTPGDGVALGVRLLVGEIGRGQAPTWLATWAETMTDVESHAYRFGADNVDGHVIGSVGGQRIDVHGSLLSELFPVGNGRHPWDVTVQLQEA